MIHTPPYDYTHSGRNWTTLVTVTAIWGLLLALVFWIDLAGWIAGLVVIASLPAVNDVVSGRRAGFAVNATHMTWFAGSKTGEVLLERVEHVRLDTRLDLSVKATLVLFDGRRIKIPFEATPPHRQLELELEVRGIKTERHHFGFI